MGARSRLARLEALREAARPYEIPSATLLYVRALENARRETEGLDPVPLTPKEERLERESERDALENLIPTLRADRGWQGEEAQKFLDEWMQDACERTLGDCSEGRGRVTE